MNILVYAGPEVYDYSLRSTLITLKRFLRHDYAIQTISSGSLKSDPWSANCALLVLPTCQTPFKPEPSASASVKDFVENGGRFLAFGAGVQVTKSSILSGPEVNPFGLGSALVEKPLKLLDRATGLTIEPTFTSQESSSTPYTTLRTPATEQVVKNVYQVRAQTLSGCHQLTGFKALAEHVQGTIGLSTEGNTIAGFVAEAGLGKVALWSTSPEVLATETPESARLSPSEAHTAEEGSRNLLKSTLAALGLALPLDTSAPNNVTHPLPQFLTSNPNKPHIVGEVARAIGVPPEQQFEFSDEGDTFHFHSLSDSTPSFVQAERDKEALDNTKWQPKHIIHCANGQLPPNALTPIFDLDKYYSTLSSSRASNSVTLGSSWNLGDALLYGESVTSTQTMLDQNPRLLSLLPAPLVSIASYQLAGRGRGGNVWVSPPGALQFSTLLRVNLSAFPSGKLVFVQYLFALAVTEACRDDAVLGKAGSAVRLKWPNDIYAVVGDRPEDRKKIGGILVNTNFSGRKAEVIIGCGLNVLNDPPLTSLAQLVHSETAANLSIERTAALILAKFEPMWDTFIRSGGSFEPFLDLYRQRWLHSDQLVTLTTVTPHRQVRISGITLDHGCLRTIPERTGWSTGDEDTYIDLQPDGNSFDLMANLIKLKS
ncbi:hypothetical protein AX16_007556 [Volvariella volvacea WC 439]|nr:hypothetical protein AX16_007556 [Volvariella volvacea WC 439]